MTGCGITDFFDLADQLPEVTRADKGFLILMEGSNPQVRVAPSPMPKSVVPVVARSSKTRRDSSSV